MTQISKDLNLQKEAVCQHGETEKCIMTLPISEDEMTRLLDSAVRKQVESRNREFIDDADTHSHISEMSRWLLNNNRPFIILCGTYGNGKTTLMKASVDVLAMLHVEGSNRMRRVEIRSAKQLAWMRKYEFSEWKELRDAALLGIDDLGEEPMEVKAYGNILTPLIDLLEFRYEKQLRTIITTNLTPQQLSDKYGPRVADRLREVAKKIVFKNESYRR